MAKKTTENVRPGAKYFAAAVIIGGLIFVGNWYLRNYGEVEQQSVVAKQQGELTAFQEGEDSQEAAPLAPGSIQLPSATPASIAMAPVKVIELPWSGLTGLNLANGGKVTTKGSLMEKRGVKLSIEMSDDYNKMKEALVACAVELKDGAKTCSNGVNFINIMGDAGASFMTGLNAALAEIDPKYQAEIVGVVGRSLGEDKCMAPARAKDNPQALRGMTIAGVQMDGDQNICLYLVNQNNICFNPDPTTYNPDCLNWMPTSTFVEAGQKYISGYCEERQVVKNDEKGVTKRTSEKHQTCADGVATWTPGDVTVVTEKAGLVSVLSTKETNSQMAAVLIGIKSWNTTNAKTVQGILAAALEGGDQIQRGGGTVLMKAAAINAQVFGQEDAKYWAKYYRGDTHIDDDGNEVRLGGSQAFNLATAARFLGLEEGAVNAYAISYTYFAQLQQKYYPTELPTFLPVDRVLNLSYMRAVLAEAGENKGIVQETEFEEGSATGETLAKRSYSITFESGKAILAPSAGATLDELLNRLTIGGGMVVEIHGHTDNTGTPNGNMLLSEGRANAVKQALEAKAPATFPKDRLKVRPHGQMEPVQDNASEAGRAANRRVEIILKSN